MVSLTEEMILNEEYQKKWQGLRQFRIEYGFECSCPEGVIYLPKEVDLDELEDWLNSKINYTCKCYA